MKKYRIIKCPVCGYEVEFCDEDDFYIPHFENIYKTNCLQCGYDYSDEKSDKKVLYEEYLKKVKQNPKYRWYDEEQPAKPHLCKVCGKYTFPNYQSFDICPYCSWEDDGFDDEEWQNVESWANNATFVEYKKSYEESLKKQK